MARSLHVIRLSLCCVRLCRGSFSRRCHKFDRRPTLRLVTDGASGIVESTSLVARVRSCTLMNCLRRSDGGINSMCLARSPRRRSRTSCSRSTRRARTTDAGGWPSWRRKRRVERTGRDPPGGGVTLPANERPQGSITLFPRHPQRSTSPRICPGRGRGSTSESGLEGAFWDQMRA